MSDDTEAKRNGRSRSGSENVSDLIADRSNSLSAAEKKVARTLIADYPTAGLGTVASLAQAGGV
ncbi:MAG: MurR/RpiR family transcriptional regulator, partial [Candidatus Saccharibacteria bacterium]|nr:MurR/RpiR family transcriptional regulator [Microbacteriaceae bacterium]